MSGRFEPVGCQPARDGRSVQADHVGVRRQHRPGREGDGHARDRLPTPFGRQARRSPRDAHLRPGDRFDDDAAQDDPGIYPVQGPPDREDVARTVRRAAVLDGCGSGGARRRAGCRTRAGGRTGTRGDGRARLCRRGLGRAGGRGRRRARGGCRGDCRPGPRACLNSTRQGWRRARRLRKRAGPDTHQHQARPSKRPPQPRRAIRSCPTSMTGTIHFEGPHCLVRYVRRSRHSGIAYVAEMTPEGRSLTKVILRLLRRRVRVSFLTLDIG